MEGDADTGLGSEKGLAVTYRSGNQTGLSLSMASTATIGTGGREIGDEVWTRR